MSLNNILGASKTAQEDLRAGDKIYALRKEPEVVSQPIDADGDVDVPSGFYDPELFDFYLVERAEVKIPERAGAVIDLHLPNEVQRWLSWWDFSQGKVLWVRASNGTRQSMAYMQGRANAAERWEVIA